MTGKIGWYLSVAAICLAPVVASAEDPPAADQQQDFSLEGEKGQGDGQTQGQEQGDEFSLEGQPPVSAEKKEEPSWETQSELEYSSEIEAGVLYNSANSFKHGEYTGLTDKAPYGIGNFDVRFRSPYNSEDSEYLQMEGSNLGLDSREVRIEGGRQGLIKGYIEYDQIPKYMSDSARTIFSGAGSSNLTLPPVWTGGSQTQNFVGSEITAGLKEVDFDYDRKQAGAGFEYDIAPNWQFRTDYQHEWKQGIQTIGGVLGSGGTGRTSLLPQPLDYVTDQATATLAYSDLRMQAELSFYVSLFDNREPSLTWHHPFSDPAPAAVNSLAALGLPPDNEAYQINFSGGYNIDPETSTRANLDVSYGWMLQNDLFLPYSVNSSLLVFNPLPRSSADAEINNMLVNFRLTSHPWQDVHLRGGYRFDDRDNQTPVALYNYIRTDSQNQNPADIERLRYNLPYSFTTHKANVEADYDFMPRTMGTLGYDFENIHRTLQEVSDTYEHTALARVKTTPADFATVNLKGSFGRRRGTNYDPRAFGTLGYPPPGFSVIDPALRKSYEANRDRLRFGGDLILTPLDQVSVGLRTDFVRDNYLDSTLGLRNRDTDSFSVDMSSALIQDVSMYGFYTLYFMESRQAGQNGFANPTTRWQVRDFDTVHTAGAGFDWMAIKDRLDLNFDYTYSFATTEYDFRQEPGIATAPLPDLKSRLQSVGMLGTYHLRKDIAVKLGYRFEMYQTQDWAVDNITFTNVPRVLGFGEISPDYTDHIVMTSVAFKF